MYKKISESYTPLFKNFYLTDLMILKKNNRNCKLGQNYAVNLILDEMLNQYGIGVFGQFVTGNLTLRGIMIFEGFPEENIEIIKQLYGFKNFTVHIQLKGFDDYALAFDYNIDTEECELQKHSWGSIKDRKSYKSISKMLKEINEKGYENLL